MSPWRPLKHQIVSIFMFFDRHFVRPASQFHRFLCKNDFLTKEVTPLDPSHKIRIEIPHKTTCLPAPPLFSDLQWWLERSEQRATEDMTSVGTQDIWRHLGGIWEVGGIWRPSESGGPFSIIKMQSNRRGQPFYRRVAKVRGTLTAF